MLKIQDKYRLELVWDKVSKQDDAFTFENVKFQGPALKDALKLSDSDSIDLDFSAQYQIVIPNFYIARFSWEGIRYSFGCVYLYNCTLKSKDIKFVPKLKDDDMIVINLYKHEISRHPFNLVYDSIVCNKEKCKYNFEEKKLV